MERVLIEGDYPRFQKVWTIAFLALPCRFIPPQGSSADCDTLERLAVLIEKRFEKGNFGDFQFYFSIKKNSICKSLHIVFTVISPNGYSSSDGNEALSQTVSQQTALFFERKKRDRRQEMRYERS